MKDSNEQNYKLKEYEINKEKNDINNNIKLDNDINKLEYENTLLRNQLKVCLQKEKFYLLEIKKLKNIQKEKDLSLNNKIIKNNLINKENTKKLSNDINLLYQEIFHKNDLIVSLQNQIYSLSRKIDEYKLAYYFKEKEYKKIIKQEKRKFNEIKLLVEQIAYESSETIKNINIEFEKYSKNLKINDYSDFMKNQSNLQILENNINKFINLMNKNNSISTDLELII